MHIMQYKCFIFVQQIRLRTTEVGEIIFDLLSNLNGIVEIYKTEKEKEKEEEEVWERAVAADRGSFGESTHI